jgi:hypothetical protein
LSHNKHVIDNINKDVSELLFYGLNTRQEAKEYYLSLIPEGFVSDYPDPVVKVHEGVRVVRDDLITGTKCRGGEVLLSQTNASKIVYVQPRVGLAGVSLLDVGKKRNKTIKLFMPASKRISPHQACCIERGCEYEFHRIAAMPNLNKIAKEWAESLDDTFFVPLGLKHAFVTAGIVAAASKIPEPEEVWTVVSTGVLHRALQIAWPNAKFYAVAVARNMKAGEVGHDRIISAPEAFHQNIPDKDKPPFPTVETYDGKAWRHIPKNTDRDILFWNVGRNCEPEDETIYDRIDSYRDWPKKIKDV